MKTLLIFTNVDVCVATILVPTFQRREKLTKQFSVSPPDGSDATKDVKSKNCWLTHVKFPPVWFDAPNHKLVLAKPRVLRVAPTMSFSTWDALHASIPPVNPHATMLQVQGR